MRADYRLQRLFLEQDLSEQAEPIRLDRKQANYLLNVLRMGDGAPVLVFNGRDGEWRAELFRTGRKDGELHLRSLTRPQPPAPDLVFAFAPLKAGRMDYLVQKGVEMGAGALQPVLTDHTQVPKLGEDRMIANIGEAAEQCGVLSIPRWNAPIRLDDWLAAPDASLADQHARAGEERRARTIIFCDEGVEGDSPIEALSAAPMGGPLAVLIGPEGGFSEAERQRLRSREDVIPIPLGPRILRADTAAVAALAIVQSVLGDWR